MWIRVASFLLIVGATIAHGTAAQAEADCDFVHNLDYSDSPGKVTERVRNCLRNGKLVRLNIYDLSNVNLWSLGFDPALPISMEIAGHQSLRALEIGEFSSRVLSRLVVERICSRLTRTLENLGMRCPFPGFFDISINDMLNMYFMSSPREMNFPYIAAPLTLGGKTGEISANSPSSGDWLVIRSLELNGIDATRINFDNIVIMGDLTIRGSKIEKIFWSSVFVLGDTNILDSQIGYFSVDGLAGAGSLRIDNVSGDDTYLKRMSFNRVEISDLQYEMSEWEIEALRRLSKYGVYRD